MFLPFLLPEYHGLNQERSAIFRALRNTRLHSVFFRSLLCALFDHFYLRFPMICQPFVQHWLLTQRKVQKKEVMYSLCNSFNLISSDLTSWSLCNEVDCTIPMHVDEKTMESNHILVWNICKIANCPYLNRFFIKRMREVSPAECLKQALL